MLRPTGVEDEEEEYDSNRASWTYGDDGAINDDRFSFSDEYDAEIEEEEDLDEEDDLLNPVAYTYLEGSDLAPEHWIVQAEPSKKLDALSLAFLTTHKLTEERKLKDFNIKKLVTMQNALRRVYQQLGPEFGDEPEELEQAPVDSGSDLAIAPDPDSVPHNPPAVEAYGQRIMQTRKPYRSLSVYLKSGTTLITDHFIERGYSSADDASSRVKKASKKLIRVRVMDRQRSDSLGHSSKRGLPHLKIATTGQETRTRGVPPSPKPKQGSIVIPARTASSSSANFVRNPVAVVPSSGNTQASPPPADVMVARSSSMTALKAPSPVSLRDNAISPRPDSPSTSPSSTSSTVLGTVRRTLSSFVPTSFVPGISKRRPSDQDKMLAPLPSSKFSLPVNSVSGGPPSGSDPLNADSSRWAYRPVFSAFSTAQSLPAPSKEIARSLTPDLKRTTTATDVTTSTAATNVTSYSNSTNVTAGTNTTAASSSSDEWIHQRDSILTISTISRQSIVDYNFTLDFDQAETVDLELPLMENIRRKSAESKKRKSKASRLSVIVSVDGESRTEGQRSRKSNLGATDSVVTPGNHTSVPPVPTISSNSDRSVQIMKRSDSLGVRPIRSTSTMDGKDEAATGEIEVSSIAIQSDFQRALGRALPPQHFNSRSLPINPSSPKFPSQQNSSFQQLNPTKSIAITIAPREAHRQVKPGTSSKQQQLLRQGSPPSIGVNAFPRQGISADINSQKALQEFKAQNVRRSSDPPERDASLAPLVPPRRDSFLKKTGESPLVSIHEENLSRSPSPSSRMGSLASRSSSGSLNWKYAPVFVREGREGSSASIASNLGAPSIPQRFSSRKIENK
ncbi:hypothetical protein BC830DRAFT_1100048 [Chytriomyces sp. MP71]|nr:hypothetical protein BC830DRAFT_1100048 [Chytriomyces sp. MP71]